MGRYMSFLRIRMIRSIKIMSRNSQESKQLRSYLHKWDTLYVYRNNRYIKSVNICETWHTHSVRDNLDTGKFWIGGFHSWISKSMKYTPLGRVSSFFHTLKNSDRTSTYTVGINSHLRSRHIFFHMTSCWYNFSLDFKSGKYLRYSSSPRSSQNL